MKRILPLFLCALLLLGMSWPPVSPDPLPAPPAALYLSPAPAARHVSPTTSLALRQGEPFDANRLPAQVFRVTGSRSGFHSGAVRLSDDRLTLLFYPDRPFAYDETVTVDVVAGLATAPATPVPGASYRFSTLAQPMARLAGRSEAEPSGSRAADQVTPRYYTHPEFSTVMTATVTTPAQGTAEGLIFLASLGNRSVVMMDDTAEPVYIYQSPPGTMTGDFKRQMVAGTPYLTFHQGVPVNVWSEGEFLVLDQGYEVVDTWTIGNGYGADVHDLQLLDNGHALLFSYTPIPADLSPYGGPVDGIVIDTVVQEQDSQKNVVFEWHGSDHVPLTDAYVPLDVSPVDFMHTNAIELDQDGNLLISSRSLSAITKIDRQTGDVIWRMGGRSSQFTFTNDPGFSFQHDVRRLDNGHLTVFDNGNAHSPPHSRAVEYRVNEAARTATRVWRYPDDTSLFAPYMGNFQRLDNGNSMMGWGALPQVTEVLPNGDVAFEVRLSHLTYRAFRFPWTGLPATPPSAVALATGDPTMATLYFSWNGATDIDGFQVFAGPTPQQMTLVTTADRTGFESSVQLSGLDPATCVFQVRPIHHQGLETPYSNFTYRLEQPACLDLLTPVYLPLVPQ